MKASHAMTTLEELGSSQWGLVTAAQAQAHGVSRVTLGRLRDDGMVHPLRRGVYALPSSGQGPLQDLRAAWLATKPSALAEDRVHRPDEVVVSHRSAASVHGLGGVMPTHHVFTSATRHTSSHPDVVFHRRKLEADEVTVVDGLLVTSIERTVADVSGRGVDLDHLAEVVRDALASEHVDVGRLAQALAPAAQRLGFATGDALIEECLERAGLPATLLNMLPLWHTALTRKLQQAALVPKVDLSHLWPSIGELAGLPQAQQRQLQESVHQLAAQSMRVATADLMKQMALPSTAPLGLHGGAHSPPPQHLPGHDSDGEASPHGRGGAA